MEQAVLTLLGESGCRRRPGASAPLAPCGLLAGRGVAVWRNQIVGTSLSLRIVGRTEAPGATASLKARRRPRGVGVGDGLKVLRSTRYLGVRLRLPPCDRW